MLQILFNNWTSGSNPIEQSSNIKHNAKSSINTHTQRKLIPSCKPKTRTRFATPYEKGLATSTNNLEFESRKTIRSSKVIKFNRSNPVKNTTDLEDYS